MNQIFILQFLCIRITSNIILESNEDISHYNCIYREYPSVNYITDLALHCQSHHHYHSILFLFVRYHNNNCR